MKAYAAVAADVVSIGKDLVEIFKKKSATAPIVEPHERALAALAERAVIAEAKAKSLETETSALRRQVDDLKTDLGAQKYNGLLFQAAAWIRLGGARPEKLLQAWRESFKDLCRSYSDGRSVDDFARDIIEHSQTCYWESPDREKAPDMNRPLR